MVMLFLVKSGEKEAFPICFKNCCLVHQHGSSRNQHSTVIILQLKIRKKLASMLSSNIFWESTTTVSDVKKSQT